MINDTSYNFFIYAILIYLLYKSSLMESKVKDEIYTWIFMAYLFILFYFYSWPIYNSPEEVKHIFYSS